MIAVQQDCLHLQAVALNRNEQLPHELEQAKAYDASSSLHFKPCRQGAFRSILLHGLLRWAFKCNCPDAAQRPNNSCVWPLAECAPLKTGHTLLNIKQLGK